MENKETVVWGGEILQKSFLAVNEHLNAGRLSHSRNVARAAASLAKTHGENVEKAYVAGLLHDIAKEMPGDEMWQLFEENGIKLSKTEQLLPKTWHAKVAKLLVQHELGIENEEILNAISYHTTGRAGMSRFEKIVYLADCISDDRQYENVGKMRELAEENLDEAVLLMLAITISTQIKKRRPVAQDTFLAYNFYTQLLMEKGI